MTENKPSTPWFDAKLRFDVKNSDLVVDALKQGLLKLPKNWNLHEVFGGTGIGTLIFRVYGRVRLRDGEYLLSQIKKLEKNDRKNNMQNKIKN